MIDYVLIGKVIDQYKELGFKFIDVPWAVSKEAIDATIPESRKYYKFDYNYLVGSAEQSFIQMMLDGKLESGSYMAATPCFRDNFEDEFHQKCFFKVELIKVLDIMDKESVGPHSLPYIDGMVRMVTSVLCQYTQKEISCRDTKDGVDLEIDCIEIGSYGKREYKNFSWIYGTGIAEPRFSSIK
jgi:hypothetical protein